LQIVSSSYHYFYLYLLGSAVKVTLKSPPLRKQKVLKVENIHCHHGIHHAPLAIGDGEALVGSSVKRAFFREVLDGNVLPLLKQNGLPLQDLPLRFPYYSPVESYYHLIHIAST